MRLNIFLAFLFVVVGASAAVRPVSMSTTNGQAVGTTTIGGRLIATNTVSNGGTNHFAGTINSATNISSQGIFYGNGISLSNIVGSLKTRDFGVLGYSTEAAALAASPQHAQLQAVFDAALSLGGASIEFENGKFYYLGTNVNVHGDNITVIGNGATILRDNHTLSGYGANTVPLSMFCVNVKSGSGTDYDSEWSKNIRFEGLRFVNSGATAGLSSDPGYFTNLNGVTVTYNRRQNKQVNQGSGIVVTFGRNVGVVNCTFNEVGFSVNCTSDSVTNSGRLLRSSVYMENCEVIDWGSVGALPGQDSVIKNCIFTQNAPRLNQSDIASTLGTSHAIYVSGGKDNVLIDGCWITGARYFGVQWYTSSVGSHNGMVVNCHFNECYITGIVSADSQISHDNFRFSNNSVTNCGGLTLGSNSGNTNQLFTVQNNSFLNYSDTDYQLIVNSGKSLVQGNLFQGSLLAHVVVQGINVNTYSSVANRFIQDTNWSGATSSGTKLVNTTTNCVYEFIGDSYLTDKGIMTSSVGTTWKSLTIQSCYFDCSSIAIFIPNGFNAIANFFRLAPGTSAYNAYDATSINQTFFNVNTFMAYTNPSSAIAISNDADNYTNQLVMVNNYFGSGVAVGSSTSAADVARFKPIGLFNGHLYSTNGYFSGSVGIGTPSPGLPLHVVGVSPLRLERSSIGYFDNTITIANSGSVADLVFESGQASSGFLFRPHSSANSAIDALSIDRNGNVGVGKVSAGYRLDVQGLAGDNAFIKVNSVLGAGDSGIIFNNSVDAINSWVLMRENAGNLRILHSDGVYPAGTTSTRLAIDTTGNVGIGTNTPNYRLDVMGTINASTNISSQGIFHGDGSGLTNLAGSSSPFILYTNGSGTNTTFYGPLIVSDYLYATNSGRTNTIAGKIVGLGGIATGSGGVALGLNNQASSYSLGVGIGNKSFGQGTIIGGISNTAFSGSQHSLVSGGSNTVSGPSEFVSGSRNIVQGDNSAAIGSDMSFDANAHNSVGIGTGITFATSPSNTVAISAGTGGITVTRSNAIYLNASSGVFVSGGPITADGAGITGVPVAGINGIRHGISGAMVLGTVTVTDTGCTANTRYFFSAHTLGTISIPGSYYASTRTASTSFVISSSQATETSTIDWMALEP